MQTTSNSTANNTLFHSFVKIIATIQTSNQTISLQVQEYIKELQLYFNYIIKGVQHSYLNV